MQRSSKQYFFYFITLLFGVTFYCYEFSLRISPSVVMDQLMMHFHVGAFGLTQVLAVYYLAYGVGQIPAGLLLDRYPVRLILGGSALLCAAAMILFVYSPTAWLATMSRFLIGLFSSVAFVGALKLGEVYLPKQYFTRLVGVVVALGTISAAYGNVLLAYLVDAYTWQELFLMIAGVGAIISLLFICAYVFFPKKMLHHENSIYTLQDFLNLLKSKFLWINAFIGGLFYLPTAVFSDIWGNSFLHTTYHLAFVSTTGMISLMFVGWMIGSLLTGYLADRLRYPRWVMAGGAALTLLVLTGLFQAWPIVATHLSLTLFLLGFFGSAQLGVWRLFQKEMTDKLVATGIALTNMIITFTITLGQFMMGYLLGFHQHSDQLSDYTAQDYHRAFICLALPLVLVLLAQGIYALRKE